MSESRTSLKEVNFHWKYIKRDTEKPDIIPVRSIVKQI